METLKTRAILLSNKLLYLLVPVKRGIDWVEEQIFFMRRKMRKRQRRQNSHIVTKRINKDLIIPIGILCVKKIAYARLAIKNINSLHFINQDYKCYLYCDQECYLWLKKHQTELDYASNTEILPSFKIKNEPWQKYKIKAAQKISTLGGALVDADSKWFSEPLHSKNKVIFLARAYEFIRNNDEQQLLTAILPRREWEKSVHYATGYLFIPKKYVTPQLFSKIEAFRSTLVKTIKKEKLPVHLLRLIDEISLNVILQQIVPKENISVLKKNEKPGDRKILLSYYYGCWNQIIE